MWNVHLDQVVSAFVDTMLPRFSKDKGILVNIRLRLSHEDNTVTRTVHMIFSRPRSYTIVMATAKAHSLRDIASEDWKMYSHHDSCWRSDGFRILSSVWREMRDALGNHPTSTDAYIDSVRNVDLKVIKYEDESRFGTSYRPESITLIL